MDVLTHAADELSLLGERGDGSLYYESTVQFDDWNEDGAEEVILHTQLFAPGPYHGGMSIAFYRDRETGEWQGKQIWPNENTPEPSVSKASFRDSQGHPYMLVAGEFAGADHWSRVLLVWRWTDEGLNLALRLELSDWCGQPNEWEFQPDGSILVPAAEATWRCDMRPATLHHLRGEHFVAEQISDSPVVTPVVCPTSVVPESDLAPVYPGWTWYTNADHVREMAFDRRGNLWVLTPGQIVRWDLNGMGYTKYDVHADSVATAPDGSMWFGDYGRGVYHFDGRTWTLYSAPDGPTSDTVRSVVVAPDGAVWVGTEHGVSRFDGKNWATYTTRDGLADDAVWSIVIAPDGVLWFITDERGVSRFDGEHWQAFRQRDGLASDTVRSIATAPDGALWFGTADGVSRFDGETWTTYTDQDGLGGGYAYPVAVLDDDLVCCGIQHREKEGISCFDGEAWSTYTTTDGLEYGPYNTVNTTIRDDDGALWFGSSHGLARFDGKTWTVHNSLVNNNIRAVTIAPDGTLWVGTDGGGVSRFDGQTWSSYITGDGPADNYVESIAVAPDGVVWIGTRSGVSRFANLAVDTGISSTGGERAGKSWTTYTPADGLGGNFVSSIATGADGVLWLGTGNGATRFTAPAAGTGDSQAWKTYTVFDGLGSDMVESITIAPDGSVWVGTLYGGVSQFTGPAASTSTGATWTTYAPVDGLVDNSASSVAVDSNGTVWAGTPDGVSYFREGAWATLDRRGLTGQDITAIVVAPDGSLWFATYEGSIAHFDGTSWAVYGRESGLRFGSVLSLAAAADGILWVGTYQGLYRFDGENWTRYTTGDGLVDNTVTAVAVAPDGSVWLGSLGGGVSHFVPPN